MAPILPGHGKTGASKKRVIFVTHGAMGSLPCENNEIPEGEAVDIDKGKTPHQEEDTAGNDETPHEEEDTVGNDRTPDDDVRNNVDEVAGAGRSEADPAENAKLEEVPVFPLLGVLGFITANSPRVICTVDLWPSAPTLSARALNILRVATGAGPGAVGIFLTEGDAICLGAGARLWKPLAPGHCGPGLPHWDQGSEGGAPVAAAIHGNCGWAGCAAEAAGGGHAGAAAGDHSRLNWGCHCCSKPGGANPSSKLLNLPLPLP